MFCFMPLRVSPAALSVARASCTLPCPNRVSASCLAMCEWSPSGDSSFMMLYTWRGGMEGGGTAASIGL